MVSTAPGPLAEPHLLGLAESSPTQGVARKPVKLRGLVRGSYSLSPLFSLWPRASRRSFLSVLSQCFEFLKPRPPWTARRGVDWKEPAVWPAATS